MKDVAFVREELDTVISDLKQVVAAGWRMPGVSCVIDAQGHLEAARWALELAEKQR